MLIISSDKDLMQLVAAGCRHVRPGLGTPRPSAAAERNIDEARRTTISACRRRRSSTCRRSSAISTDNVPGVPGIGVKTAAQLIDEYGDLETLLARADEIKQPKRREALTDPASVARIRVAKSSSRSSTTCRCEMPLDELGLPRPDGKTLIAFLKAMEFTQLTRRVAETYGVDAGEIEPDPRFRGDAPAGAAQWRGGSPLPGGAAVPAAMRAPPDYTGWVGHARRQLARSAARRRRRYQSIPPLTRR